MSEKWEALELPAELARALAGLLASARETGARIERECNGGATATYFGGNLIICHPDMPPHMWDGEKMVRLLPTTPTGAEIEAAEAALVRQDARQGENVDEWAQKLAEAFSTAND